MKLRGKIAIVTPYWGVDEDEQIAVVRLVAGALARQFHIEVIHLDANAREPLTRTDSAFTVTSVPFDRMRRSQETLMRVALGGEGIPDALSNYLDQLIEAQHGSLEDAYERIEMIDPDSVVLCGPAQPYDLDRMRGRRHRRIVFMPVGSRPFELERRLVSDVMATSDLVIATHPGEQRSLAKRFPAKSADVVALDLALSVNRGATGDTLFGVRFFQPFVLLIRRFGSETTQSEHTVTHEIVTEVAGTFIRSDLPAENWRYTDDVTPEELPLSVAEVDGDHWQLSDNVNMLPLPVTPTRVNLWRLMAHALFTIDVRTDLAFGRDALESLMFGTPVIVPESSAARAHAEAANAGLWYRNNGELLDAVRVLTDRRVRERFSANARAYTGEHHSDLARFVERICALVLPEMS